MSLPTPELPQIIESGSVVQRETWDDAVVDAGGHLLQSWRWGEFKSGHGWDVERVQVRAETGNGFAQVFFRSLGPLSLAYMPRVPVIQGDVGQIWPTLRGEIESVARSHRAVSLVVEPDDDAVYSAISSDRTASAGPPHIQPECTVKMLLGTDDSMLADMHHKTRYHIRVAGRRGVEIERHSNPSVESMQDFYRLLNETSTRNGFAIHEASYYRDLMATLGDRAALFFAIVDRKLAACLIAAEFGDEAVYLFGGSSAKHRAHGASRLIRFEAAKWARDRGCTHYDLWGIPSQRAKGDDSRPHDEDLEGLYRFKTGFGG